jgi:regulator of protease activity HflC (stomatin/prohibitin superfamily)
MTNEKTLKPSSGYVFLLIVFRLLVAIIAGVAMARNPVALLLLPVVFVLMRGFFTVNPNSSKVMVLFGAYKGTVRDNGFFWANPFYTRQKISLRARNFDSERVKVNDKIGNPILINVILVWISTKSLCACKPMQRCAN